ncbi:MAG: glycosyltransferase [Thermoleophilaceae bacterium]|nr:glycosyltransferase [Thermoleophilaceae bacterium]
MSIETFPSVDVVVPAFNEEGHVGRCLDAIFAQDYPADRFRVWVVDAGSTDETARVVRERAATDRRLALVNGSGRLNAAQACNLGIQQGSSELIARVDAHTYLYPDYLRRAAELLTEEGPTVCCVGAQPEQVGETPFGEAVAIARGSSFGVGSSVYADQRTRAEVDTIQAGVYRRAPIEEVGGFRTDMLVGEDEELNWRLKKAGYRLVLDTSVRFVYTTRSSWGAVFRQHRNYGQSRVRVLAAHPDFLRPYHLAPPGLVATLAGLVLAAPFSRRARRALLALVAAYGAGASAASIQASRSRPELIPRLIACFPALHLGYGVGMIEGAVQKLRERLGLGEARTAVRRR